MSQDDEHLVLKQISSLREVGADEWNRIAGDSPFLRHEFLVALEHSGCVGPATAWQPSYLALRDGGDKLIAALPLYLKYDSRGEFVFDWSWADAYDRAGLDYYPKLVCAIPFTPATGARFLLDPSLRAEPLVRRLLSGARRVAGEAGASSIHVLFPSEAEKDWLDSDGFLSRKSCQFHWHNEGYRDFDDFLGRFSSAKRKKARRERRRIAEANISFEQLRGDEPSADDWDAIFDFYSRTFMRRGRPPYLNRAMFDEISRTMPENLVIMLARYERQPIATAICFRGGDTLYGRYWGSLADFHSLHFETCYYQGIEYCIREGLQRFEPGTQGEHKISRGFRPTATWSCHYLNNPNFHAAVEEFLTRESSHIDAYIEQAQDHVPYRRDSAGNETR